MCSIALASRKRAGSMGQGTAEHSQGGLGGVAVVRAVRPPRPVLGFSSGTVLLVGHWWCLTTLPWCQVEETRSFGPSRSKMRREVPALRLDANGPKRGCRPHAPVGGGDCDDGVLAPVLDAVGWCLSLRLCRGRPRPQCRSSGSAPCYTCRQRRTSHESHRLHRFTRALGHGGKRAFVRAGAGGAAALCTL